MMHRKVVYLAFLSILILQACGHSAKNGNEQQSDSLKAMGNTSVSNLSEEIANDSLDAGLYFKRSGLYYEQLEYNKALSDIRRAIELDSANADYYLLMADVYTGLDIYSNSFASLDKAIAIDPTNEKAHLKKAELDVAFRNFDDAIRNIDRVMEINDLNTDAIYLRGVVFLETGDTALAVRNFQRAVEINPDFAEPNMELGMLFAAKKNDLAIDYYSNVLNIDPSNIQAKYAIAMFYQETGRYEEAIKEYEAILSENEKFVFAHYNLGYVELVYNKNYEKAIGHFEKAVEINPKYPDAFYNIGFCYELLGDIQKSLDNYRKAIELEPNHQKAVEGLNRIDKMLDGR